jgi:hypothetical protein
MAATVTEMVRSKIKPRLFTSDMKTTRSLSWISRRALLIPNAQRRTAQTSKQKKTRKKTKTKKKKKHREKTGF